MLRAKIKIGEDGSEVYTDEEYGLIYLDSDKRVGFKSKGFESTSYPEQEGENIIPKTVNAPFDYKVKFFVRADSVDNANAKITAFNEDLYDYQLDGSNNPTDTKVFKKVEFYNIYKRHKIVGYPQEISEALDFWQDGIPANDPRHKNINDVVVVEWTIRVTKPSDCDFNYTPATT